MIAELGAGHLVRLALLDVGDRVPARRAPRAFRRVVADVRLPHRAPLAPPERGVARGLHVELADLAALGRIGRQELRPAPALQRRRKLPGQIDGVADAGIHAEPAGRNDEMRGVAGDEDPALAVAVGEQQVLLPLADIERIELQRHADGLRKHAHHLGVAVDDGVQREMAAWNPARSSGSRDCRRRDSAVPCRSGCCRTVPRNSAATGEAAACGLRCRRA